MAGKFLKVMQREVSASIGLEGALAELMSYGRPRLSCMSDLKWHCNVELNTDKSAVSGAKVSSSFCEPTPLAAANAVLKQCRSL